MVNKIKTAPEPYARFLTEHKQQHALLNEVTQVLAERKVEPATLSHLLSDVKQHVQAHMAHEEEGGYFAEALAQAPELTERCEHLHAQHPALLSALNEVLQQAQSDTPSDTWWKELANQYQALLHRLNEHEAAENRLMQEAFSRDLGMMD